MSSPSQRTTKGSAPRTLAGRLDSGLTESQVHHLNLHYDSLFDRGVSFPDRIITLTGEVDTAMFERVNSALTELEALGRKAITIRLNSPGGYTYDALAIVGRIERSPCKIVTEGYGAIMSAATLIFASGDVRRVSKLSWLMVHQSTYEVEGKHNEVRAYVTQMDREEHEWVRWMEQFSDRDAKFWLDVARNKDTYFNAEELVALGVADEIF